MSPTWKPADGPLAALEIFDGPSELAVDAVPSADQATPLATYSNWVAEDTRVITCTIGEAPYRGERFDSREAARAAIERRHGRILEANYVPGRAFFRVLKPKQCSHCGRPLDQFGICPDL